MPSKISEIMQKVDYSEKESIILYNYIPRLIEKYAILVHISDQYYYSSNSQIVLTENQRGKYWIIVSNYDNYDIYWLFPITNLNGRINLSENRENQIFNLIFDCHNYENSDSRQFILEKPAQVYPSNDGNGWILEKQGIIDFSNSSLTPLSVIESNGKITQNQSQLVNENQPQTPSHSILPSVSKSEFNQYIDKSQGEMNSLKLQIQQLQQEILGVKDKYNDLETKLSNIQSQKYQTNENIPLQSQVQKQVEKVEEIPKSKSVTVNLSSQEMRIVEVYNSLQFATISQQAKQVSETNSSIEKRRQGTSKAIVLERQPQGYYWLLMTRDILYLTPRKHLTINQATVSSLKVLFEYEGKEKSKFKLIKPARVVLIDNTQTWQLTERGIIEFE